MNLKVLFIAFLCLLSASIIFTTAIVALNTMERCSLEAFTSRVQSAVHSGYLMTNGTEPAGDPTGGWPGPK